MEFSQIENIMKNLDYEAPEEQENEMQEAEDHAEETVTEQTAETDSEPQTETTGTKKRRLHPVWKYFKRNQHNISLFTRSTGRLFK